MTTPHEQRAQECAEEICTLQQNRQDEKWMIDCETARMMIVDAIAKHFPEPKEKVCKNKFHITGSALPYCGHCGGKIV